MLLIDLLGTRIQLLFPFVTTSNSIALSLGVVTKNLDIKFGVRKDSKKTLRASVLRLRLIANLRDAVQHDSLSTGMPPVGDALYPSITSYFLGPNHVFLGQVGAGSCSDYGMAWSATRRNGPLRAAPFQRLITVVWKTIMKTLRTS
jgi:hypothetical protein